MARADFGASEYNYAVAVEADNQIVVAGQASSHFALARFNTDGSLDGGFGGDGKVTTTVDYSDFVMP